MKEFIVLQDAKGRPYFNFKNIRVTLAEVDDPAKRWFGRLYLQILAYRNGESGGQTYPGPQIPITVPVGEGFDHITALRAFHASLIGVTGGEEAPNQAV